MQKTILLTGSNGFTGYYVKTYLQTLGYKVIGLVLSDPQENECVCDLNNKEQLNRLIQEIKPNGLIHLAALSFVGHADQEAFYKVNVFGTLNLLEAFANAGITPDKIIIASSANIYGMPDIEFISEDVLPAPMNHYAMSKLAMEYMVRLWFDRFKIIITRPFNYTGVGQDVKFLVPKIVSHFKENKAEIELGNIDVYRDFSDVRDIARAYVELYQSDAYSEAFNLCSGKLYALKDIISMMEEIAGYQIEIKINPLFVRENEIKKLGGSSDKLRSLIDFKSYFTLPETLNDMYYS